MPSAKQIAASRRNLKKARAVRMKMVNYCKARKKYQKITRKKRKKK